MSSFLNRSFGRRDLLRLMGLGGASYFLPSLAGRRAEAQNMTPPKRLLVLYAGGSWTTRVGDLAMRPPWSTPDDYNLYDFSNNGLRPDPQEWEFSFTDPRLQQDQMSKILEPFWRHRSKMTVIEGLGLLSSGLDPNGDAHASAHIHGLGGSPSAYEFDGVKSWAAEPSIDQRVHEHLLQTNPSLVSLDFRAWQNRGGPDMFHEMLYRSLPGGGVTRLATESNPNNAFQRLFAGRADMGDPLEAAQSNVLDLVMAQHARLSQQLGGVDRQKLEAHRSLISDIQARLAAPVVCQNPAAPLPSAGVDRVQLYQNDVEAFGRMLAMGFSCGLSQVGSLGLVYAPTEAYGLPPGAAIHHDYEHHIFLDQWFDPAGPAPDNLAGYNGMLARNIYQANQVAGIVDQLDAIPEGNGTVLDNTLVVYWSELSHGNHGHEDTYFVLFGGGGGAIRPGRYLKYKRDNPNPWNRNYRNEYTNTPHSHLLVSIAQAFGVPIDHLPGAQSCVGSVPHGGISNVTIPLSGPLPRLAYG